MIVLDNIIPKKREHLCLLANSKNFKFKGKTWKIPKKMMNIFFIEDEGVKFYLRRMMNSFKLEMTEAKGYNNKYIQSFRTSILDSLAKRPKICKDCVFRFQYNLALECKNVYKKSAIIAEPDD